MVHSTSKPPPPPVIHCLYILYFGKGGGGEEVREKVPYIQNTVRIITDKLFPVENNANVRRKMYMCGSVTGVSSTDGFFYKLTSIILNFNMWECKLKKKVPSIATVRTEFFYMFGNVLLNSGKLTELAAHSNVPSCRRWRAGEHGRG